MTTFNRMQKLAGLKEAEEDFNVEAPKEWNHNYLWTLYEHDGRGSKDEIDTGSISGFDLEGAVGAWFDEYANEFGAELREPSDWIDDEDDYTQDELTYLDEYLEENEDGSGEIYFSLDGAIGILTLKPI